MRYVRRKVFICYHHDDQDEVNAFIDTFDYRHRLFISRSIGFYEDDYIYSWSDNYIISKIRQEYMSDTTVTIVLIGEYTWSRKFVDWEIKASLRQGKMYKPNGLLGINLPYMGSKYRPPERLELNLPIDKDDGYARYCDYPRSASELADIIDEAYRARQSKSHLIVNPQYMYRRNRACG